MIALIARLIVVLDVAFWLPHHFKGEAAGGP
jgi:hypothetical protein